MNRHSFAMAVVVSFPFLFGVDGDQGQQRKRSHGQEQPSPGNRSVDQNLLASLGVAFIPNEGQFPEGVRFQARKNGVRISVFHDRILFQRGSSEKNSAGQEEKPHQMALRFFGASSGVEIEPMGQLPGRYNYYLGSDPKYWREGVPSYSRLQWKGVYPGIDVDLYERGGNLEYDVVLHPGADPSRFSVQLEGEDAAFQLDDGKLVASSAGFSIVQTAPKSFRLHQGERAQEVASSFDFRGPRHFGFHVDNFDPTNSYVIDPQLLFYSSFVGGTGTELDHLATPRGKIAVDALGNSYIAGGTTSSESTFPLSSNAYDSDYAGSTDAFVVKLNDSGSGLLYGTYIGGTSTDEATDIDVDANGKIYITGYTESSNFPAPSPAFQSGRSGDSDAFVTILNSDGTLNYSTYLGGGDDENVGGDKGAIKVDGAGKVHVVGSTESDDFPVGPAHSVYDSSMNLFYSTFYFQLDTSQSNEAQRVYSTFIGGSNYGNEGAYGIDLGSHSGTTYVFIVGVTYGGFPTPSGYKTSFGGQTDAFLAVLNPNPANAGGDSADDSGDLVYGTYLGGTATEYAFAVAAGSNRIAYVVGQTISPNSTGVAEFKLNSFQSSPGDTCCGDAFLVKIDTTVSGSSGLLYGTYFGGSASETAYDICLNGDDDVYITGYTYSSSGFATGFPSSQAFQSSLQGGSDAFVARFNTDASGQSSLKYGSYLGGSSHDQGRGVAIQSGLPGAVFVMGIASSGFPTTSGSFETSYSGNYDAFLCKMPVPAIYVQSGTSYPTVSSGEAAVEAGGLVILKAASYHESSLTLDAIATYTSDGGDAIID